MRPARIISSQLAFFIVALSLDFLGREAHAQLLEVANAHQKKDTICIFNNRLKITLKEGVFEEIPNHLLTAKYAHAFGIAHLVNVYGLVLRSSDTLVFYQTSIDRPTTNDGGVSIWQMISPFADKIPAAHWVESGWTAAGKDFIYFVKLISEEEAKLYFEFNFFFIENKLTFSVLQHPLFLEYFTDQKNYGILLSK